MLRIKSLVTLSSLVIAFFFISSTQISSQTAMDKMASDACVKIKDLDLDKMSGQEVEKALENIMVAAVMENYTQLSKEEDIDITTATEADFEAIGEKLGMKLLSDCPEFFNVAMKMGMEEVEEEVESGEFFKTVEGKFIGLEGEEFVYVKIKDASGKTHKLLWTGEFPGDELVTSKKLKGEKVKVTYTEGEYYNGKSKDYVTVKEITALEQK